MRVVQFGLWAAILLSLEVHGQGFLPDPEETPGVVDEKATVEKVCVPGYSNQVRPRTSYTNRLKHAKMRELWIDNAALYEEDHRVPLCAGGHATDPHNLWLQPRKKTGEQWNAEIKDQLETSVCRQLCRGEISLQDAQAIFLSNDWTIEYEKFFGYR